MKVLLDENLPSKLHIWLIGHDVTSVEFMGWKGITNGRLLAAAVNPAPNPGKHASCSAW